MTLIKCPHCGHSVLSVASVCPTCSGSLGVTFLGPEHAGELTECRACGHGVRSRTRVCPNCGIPRPARRPWLSYPFIGASALLLIGALVTSVWRDAHPDLPDPDTAAKEPSPATLRQPVTDSARSHRVVDPVPVPIATTAPQVAQPAPSPDSVMRWEPVIEAAAEPAPARAPTSPSLALTPKWTRLWVNVRQRPQDNAPILRVLRPGTRVDGLARRYGWWLIFIDGDSVGYVAGGLLQSRPGTQSASLR